MHVILTKEFLTMECSYDEFKILRADGGLVQRSAEAFLCAVHKSGAELVVGDARIPRRIATQSFPLQSYVNPEKPVVIFRIEYFFLGFIASASSANVIEAEFRSKCASVSVAHLDDFTADESGEN